MITTAKSPSDMDATVYAREPQTTQAERDAWWDEECKREEQRNAMPLRDLTRQRARMTLYMQDQLKGRELHRGEIFQFWPPEGALERLFTEMGTDAVAQLIVEEETLPLTKMMAFGHLQQFKLSEGQMLYLEDCVHYSILRAVSRFHLQEDGYFDLPAHEHARDL